MRTWLLPRLMVALFALVGATAAWAQPSKRSDDSDGARRSTLEQRVRPEQRDAIRQRWQERRESGDSHGRRFSPEERRQLRDQIYESNRARPLRPGKRGR